MTALSRTERQADGLASIVTFGLVLLGGNFIVLAGAPPPCAPSRWLTPNGWALRAFTDLSTGADALGGHGDTCAGDPGLLGSGGPGRAAVVPTGGTPMNALWIAGVSLRRMLRDRTGMFFIVLLPIVVILVIGVTVGGQSTVRVAVVDLDHSAIAADLVHELDSTAGITLVRIDTPTLRAPPYDGGSRTWPW